MITFEQIYEIFDKNRNAENALPMAHYMKDHFVFFGINSGTRKELEKPFIQLTKQDKTIDWVLIDECFSDKHREMQYFALDYLKSKEKLLTYEDVPHLFKLAKTKQWWDTIDIIDRLIGNIGLKDQRIDDLMLSYSVDDDMWIRRLAIDHQNGRKERTNTELLPKIIINNLGQKEFFINKAIGWALRDYSKVNPNWVKNFICQNKDKMATLSIKEASKYL